MVLSIDRLSSICLDTRPCCIYEELLESNDLTSVANGHSLFPGRCSSHQVDIDKCWHSYNSLNHERSLLALGEDPNHHVPDPLEH